MNFCTIVAKNYIPFARALGQSIQEHHPDGKLSVLIIDDWQGYITPEDEPFEVVSLSDLDIPQLHYMVTCYEVIELSTAVKPWLLRMLLSDEGADHVVYLDPDIQLYQPLTKIKELALEHELVLTPHNVEPIPRDGKRPNEQDILIAGAYNLGFIALGDTEQTSRFLDWWCERLESDCVVDIQNGLFVDQKWIDLAPSIFEKHHILRHVGFNTAYWNLATRKVARKDDRLLVNGQTLYFYHFSGFDPELPGSLSKHQNRIDLSDELDLAFLCKKYSERLLENGYVEAREWPYELSNYSVDIELTPLLRRLYRKFVDKGIHAQGESVTTSFLNWLAEDVDIAPGVNRYLEALYEQRPDLHLIYPDLSDGDAEGFLGWVIAFGQHEEKIPDRLIPNLELTALDLDLLEDSKCNQTFKKRRDYTGRQFGVNVAGYFNAELGVGEVARQVISGLDAVNVDLLPVGLSAPNSRQRHSFSSASFHSSPFGINLICVNADGLPNFVNEAPPGFFDNRYSIGIWWWEVSTFPRQLHESFKYLDELWVGSDFIAETLKPISPIPVLKMPLPLAPPIKQKISSRDIANSRKTLAIKTGLDLGKEFVFLFSFDFNSVFKRKNPLAVIKAFQAAFGEDEQATLVIKTINGDKDPVNLERLQQAASEHKSVVVFDGYLDSHDKNLMMAACDCYVSLHRSEGFGITLAEAMLLGKPVIGTDYSGTTDFLNTDNGYPVSYKLVPVGKDAAPYPEGAEWAEPNIEEASGYMREIFENSEESLSRAKKARTDLLSWYDNKVLGRQMKDRLNAISRIVGLSEQAGESPMTALVRPVTQLADVDAGAFINISRQRSADGFRPESGKGVVKRTVARVIKKIFNPWQGHQRNIDRHLIEAIEHLDLNAKEINNRVIQTQEQISQLVDSVSVLTANNLKSFREHEKALTVLTEREATYLSESAEEESLPEVLR